MRIPIVPAVAVFLGTSPCLSGCASPSGQGFETPEGGAANGPGVESDGGTSSSRDSGSGSGGGSTSGSSGGSSGGSSTSSGGASSSGAGSGGGSGSSSGSGAVDSGAPTGACSAANYVNIVNGQPWPSSFCPYAGNSPWNEGTAGHAHDATATAALHTGSYLTSTVSVDSDSPGPNDFSHPVYLAAGSDPNVSISCTQYGCWDNGASVSSLQALIPSAARPAQGSDHHFGVIQPNGTEVDCWDTSYTGGSTLSAAICTTGSITGAGVLNPSATSGAALAAGLIRASELQSGVIPHALFMVTSCTNGFVYPGTSAASQCGGGAGIPIGAWIHLNMTDAQIVASNAGTQAVLMALAHYGGFVLDTGGVNAIWGMCEDQQQYASFGTTAPPCSYTIDWPSLAANVEVLQPPSQ